MIRRWGRYLRRLIWPWGICLVALGSLLVATLLAANAVDTSVTDEDRAVISSLAVEEDCLTIDGYDEEIRCIYAVQSSIFERYPDTSDAFVKGVTAHRVSDYHQRGYGSCYDRATLIEQALRHYGFDVRRVALYQSQPTPVHYLLPGIRSHALSEVKTSRGWMAVESIKPLMAVDSSGIPYSIDQIRQGMQRGNIDDHSFNSPLPDDFFDGDFVYVYGVHSRHGYFFEPHLPVPEIDWSNFGR